MMLIFTERIHIDNFRNIMLYKDTMANFFVVNVSTFQFTSLLIYFDINIFFFIFF